MNPSEEQLTALATSELSALTTLLFEIDAMNAEYQADECCDPVKLNAHIERVYDARLAMAHSLATVTAENGKLREAAKEAQLVLDSVRTWDSLCDAFPNPLALSISPAIAKLTSALHPNTGAGS